MNTVAIRANRRKLLILAFLVLLCAAGYMLVEVNFSNPKLLAYAMKIRTPKLIVMLITAFSIGGASLVFQSIINNTIVTPCLLGMNSLYTLIHTAVVFFLGSASVVASNANLSFAVDVVLMGIAATVIYSWIFKKTKHNVLYVLLVGTVLTSFFSSIQTTLTRVMDPNEYDSLLNTLVASFSNINSEIIVFSLILLASVIFALRKELALLDVLTLGKEQAINLGVDYDRCIRRLLLGVTLCIAVATAMVGPISFLGLIIANLSRQLLKTFRHTQLVLGSALFGMIVLVPAIRNLFHLSSGACLLAAMIVLAIMILPSIINVSETALRAVPKEYEEASLALGAAEMETYFRVSVHAARSGIAAAVVLGVGRAIGEAMAIILVAGNVSNMPGLFTPVRFLTTGIISGMAYASVGSLYQQALYSIGLVLFLFIMLINVFLNVCVKNRKEG